MIVQLARSWIATILYRFYMLFNEHRLCSSNDCNDHVVVARRIGDPSSSPPASFLLSYPSLLSSVRCQCISQAVEEMFYAVYKMSISLSRLALESLATWGLCQNRLPRERCMTPTKIRTPIPVKNCIRRWEGLKIKHYSRTDILHGQKKKS